MVRRSSLAHGDLARVILIGRFALSSAVGMLVIDRRNRRRLGAQEWQRMA